MDSGDAAFIFKVPKPEVKEEDPAYEEKMVKSVKEAFV